MTATLKVLLAALMLVCIYVTTSKATYYQPPPPGKWGPWSNWSKCSKKCNGLTVRTRKCLSGPYDPPCQGTSKQKKRCNEQCPVRIGFKRSLYRVYEGRGKVVIQVTRSGYLNQKTTARISLLPGGSAKQGSDFGRVNRKVVFLPKKAVVYVSISIKDDKALEKSEYFAIKLSSKDKSVASIKRSKAKVIILDNDAIIGFPKPARRTVPESVKKFTVTIRRYGATKLKHSVSVRSVDGTATSKKPNADYIRIKPTTLTFGPKVKTRQITVTILDDKLDEKNLEAFTLVLSTKDNRVNIVRGTYTVRIRDNDRNGNWGPWGSYGKCSKKCGGGLQTRTRKCNNPAPSGGGRKCYGASKSSKKCNVQPCPGNGNWGAWGSYGKCSKKCGGGVQTRTRKCNNPAPSGGGKKCPGPSTYSKKCNTKCCKVDGGFGPWSKWGPCLCVPSQYGQMARKQKRTRNCNKPKPSCGGKKCNGPNKEEKTCSSYQPCPPPYYGK